MKQKIVLNKKNIISESHVRFSSKIFQNKKKKKNFAKKSVAKSVFKYPRFNQIKIDSQIIITISYQNQKFYPTAKEIKKIITKKIQLKF